MQKVQLSNGYAMMKDKVDRKTIRLYRKALFKDAKTQINLDGKGVEKEKISFDPSSMDEANDTMVRGMVAEIYINDSLVEVTDELIDSMPSDDFDLLLEYCNKLMQKKEEEKKS